MLNEERVAIGSLGKQGNDIFGQRLSQDLFGKRLHPLVAQHIQIDDNARHIAAKRQSKLAAVVSVTTDDDQGDRVAAGIAAKQLQQSLGIRIQDMPFIDLDDEGLYPALGLEQGDEREQGVPETQLRFEHLVQGT